jgi:hypothetical protein
MREKRELATNALFLLVGVAALCIGPIMVAVLWGHMVSPYNVNVSWSAVFFWAAVVVIPLSFWGEWRYGESNFYEAARNSGLSGSTSWYSLTVNQWQALAGYYGDADVGMAFYVELCFWGPRQIFRARQGIRRVRLLRNIDRLRAAEVLADLCAGEHGVAVQNLPDADKDMGVLLGALAYLLTYEWIGVSKDGQKVWIDSDARRILLPSP